MSAVPPTFGKYLDFLDVAWTASATPNVTYNVYRSTVSGGPYTLQGTGIGQLTFRDENVTPGSAYYYVVTAVDSNKNESAHSSEQSSTVWTP